MPENEAGTAVLEAEGGERVEMGMNNPSANRFPHGGHHKLETLSNWD
jgi:hypothetical protein